MGGPARLPRRARGRLAATVTCALAALVAGSPVPSALAVFTKQATVTANTVNAAAAFPSCYRDAVVADTPSSYWRLDETSGTTAGDSKGSSPGTYRNGVSLGQSGALPDAFSNKAASFDGVDDDVQVGDVHGFAGTAAFSVEFWVNPTSTNSSLWRPLIAKEDPGADWSTRQGWAVWLVPDTNMISMERWNGTTQFKVDSLTPVKAGSWSHVVATYDGSTARLYINGTLDRSAASSLALNAHTVPLRFGSFGTAADPWLGHYAGLLDDVAISSTTLSATQVRTHYNTGRCYKDAVLADSPLGYWRLGETSGTTAADGIRGRNGTYVGTPTLNQTGGLNGDSNPAVGFNGTSQYVRVPYDGGLNPAQVTVEAWAKPTAVAGSYRAVASSYDGPGTGPGKGYWLGSNGTNWLFETFNGSSAIAVGPAVVLGSWTHLVGTYDGTTVRLYVNGLLAASTAGGHNPNAGSPFGIGATYYTDQAWADRFNGTIDDVAVYGTALSQARIQAHYILGRSYKDTVLDSTPVSYWRLGEGSGTGAADSKGSNTGTYANSPGLGQSGALAGDADTSVTFNSSTQNVTVPDAAALKPAQISVEAWVKPDSATVGDLDSPLMKTSNDSWTDGYGLFYRSSGTTMDFYVNSWGLAVAATIPLDQWTHVVGTYDGTTVRLYLNGALAASAAYSTAITHATNTLYIGSAATGSGTAGPPGYFWGGSVDDVAIYAKALSAAEIKLHYDSGRQ